MTFGPESPAFSASALITGRISLQNTIQALFFFPPLCAFGFLTALSDFFTVPLGAISICRVGPERGRTGELGRKVTNRVSLVEHRRVIEDDYDVANIRKVGTGPEGHLGESMTASARLCESRSLCRDFRLT